VSTAAGQSDSASFVHRALVFRDRDELAAQTAGFVRDGLANGSNVVAVLGPHSESVLRESLGDDARVVRFGDARVWYARLGTIIQAMAQPLAEAAATGRAVRVLAENPFAARRPREYLRCESMTNVALAGCDASVLCLYDGAQTADDVLAGVRRTHPRIIHEGTDAPSREYTEPLDFMTRSDRELSHPEAPADAPRLRIAAPRDLPAVRRFVAREAAAAGLARTAVEDLQLAASEIASNVIVHTAGPGEACVWIDGTELVCQLSDQGPGMEDPLAGYLLPPEYGSSGRGLWLARQLCDEVTVKSEAGGTVVRLRVELPAADSPPAP